MFCPNCGSHVNDDAAFCPNCGNKVKSSLTKQTAANQDASTIDPFDMTPPPQQQQPTQQQQAPQYQQQPTYQQQQPTYQQQPQYAQPPAQQNVNADNPIALVGFILSLLGGTLVSLILSIVGYQNAKKGAKYKNLAVAGIVISAISLFFSFIWFFIMMSSIGFMESILDGAYDYEYMILSSVI